MRKRPPKRQFVLALVIYIFQVNTSVVHAAQVDCHLSDMTYTAQSADECGRSQLNEAIAQGNIQQAKKLLDSGVDPNEMINIVVAPYTLLTCAILNNQIDLAVLLIKHGAKAKACLSYSMGDCNFETLPVLTIGASTSEKMYQALLKAGVKPNKNELETLSTLKQREALRNKNKQKGKWS